MDRNWGYRVAALPLFKEVTTCLSSRFEKDTQRVKEHHHHIASASAEILSALRFNSVLCDAFNLLANDGAIHFTLRRTVAATRLKYF